MWSSYTCGQWAVSIDDEEEEKRKMKVGVSSEERKNQGLLLELVLKERESRNVFEMGLCHVGKFFVLYVCEW